MRSDLREDFEHYKHRYDRQKTSLEEAGALIFKFNCYINAQCDASESIQRMAKRMTDEAKECALLRDLLETMKPKELL